MYAPTPACDGGICTLSYHVRFTCIKKLLPASWLKNDLEEWNREVSPESNDAFDSHQIKKLSLNVVQICNLRCQYCAAGGDGSYGSATKKLDLQIAYQQIQFFLKQSMNKSKINCVVQWQQ